MKKILLGLMIIISLLLIGKVNAESYNIGDTFTLNGDGYHIISANASDDYVVALKDTPLTVNELSTYGSGHINVHNDQNGQPYDWNDENHTGGMAYYTSETCRYNENDWIYDGCTTSYVQSEIKYIVDSWSTSKFTNSELKKVDGYTARLIKHDEIPSERKEICTGSCYETDAVAYDWMYNSNYWYWTMTPWSDGDQPSSDSVWYVSSDGGLFRDSVDSNRGAVRPVINVYKSAFEAKENITNEDETTNDDALNDNVDVDDTLLQKSIVATIIGVVLIGLGITTYLIVIKSKKLKSK